MSTIYRGLTQAELDRAYSPSSMVASIDPFIARYAADSAAARERHPPARWATHCYGPSPAHALDLFLPDPAIGPAPLLVFFHGGYWQALHKDDAAFPATAITAAGFAYAAVNYTLAPQAHLDAIVEDCRHAIAYLWRARQHLGIASTGIVVAGHSAGAQLAAMVLLTSDWQAFGVDRPLIKGAILIGGVYDLEPIRLSYVNEALGMDDDTAHRNSPLKRTPRSLCPLVVSWGEHETAEFKRQSADLVTAWSSIAPSIDAFEQPGRNHFDALFDWCEPSSRLAAATARLLSLSPATQPPDG